MTLHQLTHPASFPVDFRVAELSRRLIAGFAAAVTGWRANRRLEREMAGLDHRERADLTWRR